MNKYFEKKPGVWFSVSDVVSVEYNDLQVQAELCRGLERKRSRICAHSTEEDRMQEMFIAFSGDSYIKPSRHTNFVESFHLISGRGKYVFFNHQGDVISDVRLGNYQSYLPFYVRIDSNVWHTFVPYTADVVAHEVCQGPFLVNNTEFSEWSPDVDSHDSINRYLEDLTYRPVDIVKQSQWVRISEEAYQIAYSPVISISRADIDRLLDEVKYTRRDRIRVLVHPDVSHPLHEMFVVYKKTTYVMPNKHIGKDESLHVLQGEADFIFFDNNGGVINVVQLSSDDKSKSFFVRVPKEIYHTIIMRSEILVMHEVTPGPFVREDTVWAEWAPNGDNENQTSEYLYDLEKKIKAFLFSER